MESGEKIGLSALLKVFEFREELSEWSIESDDVP